MLFQITIILIQNEQTIYSEIYNNKYKGACQYKGTK